MARPFTKKEREEKKKLFLEAFDESKGMTTTSCMRVGISKQTLCNWREDDPQFDEDVRNIQDKWKEWVEGRMMTLIENGNTSAILFYLKCKGGYQEKQHLTVENTGGIDVKEALEDIRRSLTEGGE